MHVTVTVTVHHTKMMAINEFGFRKLHYLNISKILNRKYTERQLSTNLRTFEIIRINSSGDLFPCQVKFCTDFLLLH